MEWNIDYLWQVEAPVAAPVVVAPVAASVAAPKPADDDDDMFGDEDEVCIYLFVWL